MKCGNYKTRKAYKQDVHRRRRGGPPAGYGGTFIRPWVVEPSLAHTVKMLLASMFGKTGR